jgi:Zn-dependent peptidase ImmA (M78 family)/DNA-binding XRE family transcriptional regulator
MGLKEDVGARIRSARRAAGLSLRDLGRRVGVSAMAVHKYEVGQAMPGSDTLLRLSKVLAVPVDYFFRQRRPLSIRPAYRIHQPLSSKNEHMVEARVIEWLERYLEAEDLLGPFAQTEFTWPTGLDRRVERADDAERVATELREAWGLGAEPIRDLVATLEGHGIRIGVVPQVPGFNALAFWLGKSEPVMALADGYPGDRRRFSAAHELGHLALDLPQGLDTERLADRFAGAFLVPADAVKRELGLKRHAIWPDELYVLKHKYGLSMQGWLHRALDLGIVSRTAYDQVRREFRERGWETRAPGQQVFPEEPARLRQLVLRALAEGQVSQTRAAELLREPVADVMLLSQPAANP